MGSNSSHPTLVGAGPQLHRLPIPTALPSVLLAKSMARSQQVCAVSINLAAAMGAAGTEPVKGLPGHCTPHRDMWQGLSSTGG